MPWGSIMAEHGLVTLDPVRLAGLETYLAGLGDGCVRGAGAVIDDLAGTGASAPGEVAELGRIAEWCRIQAEEVVRRRRILEGLPVALLRPDYSFRSRAEARQRAEAVAADLRRVLDSDEPSWPALQRLLADVARGAHSPMFRARVRSELGWARGRALPVVVELTHRDAAGEAAESGGSGPDPALVAAREVVLDLAPSEGDGRPGGSSVSEPPGSEPPAGGVVATVNRALDLELDEETIGDIEQAGHRLGLGASGVTRLGKAARAFRKGSVRGPGPLALASFAADTRAFIIEPDDVNLLSMGSSGLALAAPATGPAAPFVLAASAVLGFIALIASTAGKRDDRYERRYNEATGESTYPSGSDDNPNVGVAGVPTRFG